MRLFKSKILKNIFATVFADIASPPFEVNKGKDSTDKGDYSYDFCINCLAKTKLSGAATNVRYCGIPIDIEILEPEKDGVPVELIIVIGLLAGILIVFLVIIFAGKKGQKTPEKRK